MDLQDDLERYEATEARELVRLFKVLRAPPVEPAPAHFRAKVLAQVAERQAHRGWFMWRAPGRSAPWIPALITGLLLSLSLNTWLAYEVLEWRQQSATRGSSGSADPAQRHEAEGPRQEEHEGSGFTLRGGPGVGTSQRQEEERRPSEAELVQALAQWAALYYQAGRYERSLHVASAALALDPDAALAYFYRGMAHDAMGNRTQAIADMRHAARLGEAQAYDWLRAWKAD
jgi:tetratricopeptide (TPR) repeat protein